MALESDGLKVIAGIAFVTSFLYCATSFFYLTTGHHATAAAWGVLGVWFWQVGNSTLRQWK